MPQNNKLYFAHSDSEICYPLEYHMESAPASAKEIELYQAVPEKISGMFWCRAVEAVVEHGMCGKQCAEYAPKNGKSGMCRHRCNTLYTRGNKVVIPINN